MPAITSATHPAQPIDASASAKFAIRDDVCRRRNWLRRAWMRKRNWIAVADAAGGHLDAVVSTLPVTGPMVQAGKMAWIAVVPPTTIPSLPNVPSLGGLLKGETIPTGNTIFAPAATPPAVLAEVHDAIRTLLRSPAVDAKLRASGLEPLNVPRADLPARIRAEAAYMKDFLGKAKVDFST